MRILLTSHGKFAEGLKDSVRMLVGQTENLDVITFTDTMGIDELKEVIEGYFKKTKEEIFIFTDLKGGTPFNVTSLITKERDKVFIWYGMNLPLVLEAVAMREVISSEELITHLKNMVIDSIGLSELKL